MPWTLDSYHSHVGFSVKHMMVSTVRGQFKTYTGTLALNDQDFSQSRFEGEIDVASIDTGIADRDNHLRSADFFDVASFPKMSFKSIRIARKGDGEFTVHGELTIKGVTREIALDVEHSGTAKNPYGKTVTGFSVRGEISRKEFGLTWNAVLETGGVAVSDKVKLELEVEAVLEDAAVPAMA